MPTVFDVLGADHAEVKQMLSELETGPRISTGATEAQLSDRKERVVRVVMASSRHEAVEEQYFWPTVRERLADGSELADQATHQEEEAKHALAHLEKLSPTDGEFDGLLSSLNGATREHIAYEEEQVWPKLRQALSTAEAEALGTKIAAAKKMAPTRPHPHTPASPALLRAAGPAVAVTDRLRDSFTGRGRRAG
ncbi:MAG TPA: hemerythrin domain-containing protein [Streptosporangiaceae bacterium]|jgi:hemerythrin-like domain-containing protein